MTNQLAETVLARDWNFLDADTGYLTHAIHRYSGKFIPQIAGQAIELLTEPDDLVVDPYCGSGTTLVEAAARGRRALGVDMNPLAVLIATVKSTPVERELVSDLVARLTQFVDSIEADGLFRTAPSDLDREDARLTDPWFTKWFQPQVLEDLVRLHNRICDEKDDRLRSIGLVAFSDVLRRSSNAHQGYPNVMYDKRGGPRPRPGRHFLKLLREVASAVVSLPESLAWANVRAEEGDARCLRLEDEVAGAVITHPPYVGSIPYAEYGALSLKWLGHDPKLLDKKLTGGARQSRHVLSRFTADYHAMIAEAYRVLKPGGHMFALVGNPTIKGELVDLAKMTSEHAMEVGFAETVRATRAGENRRANKMGEETLLIFAKG